MNPYASVSASSWGCSWARALRCSLAAVAVLAGCNAGAISPPAATAGAVQLSVRHDSCSFARAAAHRSRLAAPANYSTKKSLVFEADLGHVDINVYQTKKLKKDPAPIATFATETGYPFALATDRYGTLYVADGCNGSDVEEFAKGSTTVKTSITDGISNPTGLAIDANNTLYVSNSPAAITVYSYGASSPEETITGNGLVDPGGLAVDATGDLYVADLGADQVFELPKGSSGLTALNLQDLEEPIGVAIDQTTGLLWVTDGKLDEVNLYQLGSTTPIEEITGLRYPSAVSIQNVGKPNGTAVVSDLSTDTVYAFAPGKYSPYAKLTNGIGEPVGLSIAKP